MCMQNCERISFKRMLVLKTNTNGLWWLAFKTDLFLFSLGDELIVKEYLGTFEISALDFVQIKQALPKQETEHSFLH